MGLAFVILVGVAFAVTAFVMTGKSAIHTALAGQNTVVGLGDAAAETLAGGTETPPPARTDWQLTTVDNLSHAEDLLDCLEAQGYAERELLILGNSCFAVRWR